MPTITKRNSTYRITVSCGYDLTGKQIRRSMTWKPAPGMTARQIEREVERQAILFEEKCRSGQFLDGAVRFADFADYWMEEYAKKQLRPTTVSGYVHMLERINAAIGHIRLDQLQPHHLMELYTRLGESGARGNKRYTPAVDFRALLKDRGLSQNRAAELAGVSPRAVQSAVYGDNLSEENAGKIASALGQPINALFAPVESNEKPLSGKTILHHHRLVSSILERAVKWQVILMNPCDRVEPPKAERKEARYLDERQAAQMLECLAGEPTKYRAMVTVLLYSGMRRGELCGLEWRDVNFVTGLVDIQRSSLYLAESGVFEDETKNATSRRTIKLPAPALDALRELMQEQAEERLALGDRWEESGRIFTQWNGKPIHPDTLTAWFGDFIKRHNLPDVCLHSLRHTNATLMIAGGVDVRTVSKRLGHAQTSTTTNIYAHAIQSADERAAETLDNLLTPGAGHGTKKTG